MQIDNLFYKNPEDPMPSVMRWYDDAIAKNVNKPGAIALASVNKAGQVSNRVIQIINLNRFGIIFTSHEGSQKGKDFKANAWVSALFYWRELGKQMILSGYVEQLPKKECDDLWLARPSDFYPMSIASKQSDILLCEEKLLNEANKLSKNRAILLRPKTWLGYLLKPNNIEFWQASSDKLHKRLKYEWSGNEWTAYRLQP